MLINVASTSDFSRLLDGLGQDVVDAAMHLKLYADINAAISEYHRELNESRAFWSLTFEAHWKVALGCLIRAYDQHPASLCLANLIDTITESPHLGSLRSLATPAANSDALAKD